MPRTYGQATGGQQAALYALGLGAGLAGRKRTGYAVDDPADWLQDQLDVGDRAARKHLTGLADVALVGLDRHGNRIAAARVLTATGFAPVPLIPFDLVTSAAAPALLALCDVLSGPGRPGLTDDRRLYGQATVAAMARRSGRSRQVIRDGLAHLETIPGIERTEQPGDQAGDWWSIDFGLYAQAFTVAPEPLTAADVAARAAMAATDVAAQVLDDAHHRTTPARRLDPPPAPAGTPTGTETGGVRETGDAANGCSHTPPPTRCPDGRGPYERHPDSRSVLAAAQVLDTALAALRTTPLGPIARQTTGRAIAGHTATLPRHTLAAIADLRPDALAEAIHANGGPPTGEVRRPAGWFAACVARAVADLTAPDPGPDWLDGHPEPTSSRSGPPPADRPNGRALADPTLQRRPSPPLVQADHDDPERGRVSDDDRARSGPGLAAARAALNRTPPDPDRLDTARQALDHAEARAAHLGTGPPPVTPADQTHPTMTDPDVDPVLEGWLDGVATRADVARSWGLPESALLDIGPRFTEDQHRRNAVNFRAQERRRNEPQPAGMTSERVHRLRDGGRPEPDRDALELRRQQAEDRGGPARPDPDRRRTP